MTSSGTVRGSPATVEVRPAAKARVAVIQNFKTMEEDPELLLDQSPVEDGPPVEIAAGGVSRVNGDLAVSRGFGDSEHKKTGGPGQEATRLDIGLPCVSPLTARGGRTTL